MARVFQEAKAYLLTLLDQDGLQCMLHGAGNFGFIVTTTSTKVLVKDKLESGRLKYFSLQVLTRSLGDVLQQDQKMCYPEGQVRETELKKSRSLSIRRGKVDETTTFTVAEQQIPTVSQEPVKSLGRWYDSSMKDTRRRAETLELAFESLLAIKKCVLQGTFKIWCLQFMLIPKLLWPLLVYDICSSTVEAIEAKINKYTRKWLGVPPGLSDVAMYCRKAKLKLPMTSILEEYKCGKARLLTMLEESDDPMVKTVQPSLKTGRKWKVTEAVDEAKECLKMKEVISQTQTDRRGLGSTTAKWWSKTEGKEKRDMFIDEIRNKEDSARVQKAVQQPQQGQWANWDTAIQRSLTSNDIWHMAPLRISFLIRSVYDLLSSNANLVRGGKKDDPTCPLCQGRQTEEHVLSSCKVALSQGRYTWRHNRVLQEFGSVISTAKGKLHPSSTSSTVFTTEGGVKKWHGWSIPINTDRSARRLRRLGGFSRPP
ncbi:reverse transcriptase [Plakobranchus ocellatus]|uniref:Reverse transcriptase n=1 Tax=Plakobranchus ocellatus TaxID=259542 RepID=A0AAV3YPK4_9GAST|nr:reverse transcriptase [Plakobranchus ocellatus]